MPLKTTTSLQDIENSWGNRDPNTAGGIASQVFDPLGIGVGQHATQINYGGKTYTPDANAFQSGNMGSALAAQQSGLFAQGAAAQDRTNNQWAPQQQSLASLLAAQANGSAPSAAQQQLKSGEDDAIAAARAQAAGSTNPAFAQQLAMNAQTQAMLKTNQQAAQLRAQEQASGQQNFGQFLAQARGADQTQQQMNDQLTQYYVSQGLNLQQAQLQANIAQQQMMSDQTISANQIAAGIATQQAQMDQQAKGGILSAAGSVIGGILSDRRAKKNIKSAAKDTDSFIRALKAYRFDYKDPANGAGHQFGVMAQDLEKSKIGRTLVTESPDGHKVIDTTRGYGAVLAALNRLDTRLGKVETQKAA